MITITINGTVVPPPAVPAPVITSFTASPGTINAGQSSTLSWVVSNATTLTISGIGLVTGNTRSVTPAATTTYVLTATNSVGAFVTALATVTVNTPGGGGPSPVISFTSPTAGQTINGIWYFQVAVPASIQAVSGVLRIDSNAPYPLFGGQDGFVSGVNTARFAPGTHTATATVTDKANVDYTATVSFVIGTPPVVPPPVINSFLATPSAITAGQSSTLTWSVSNATSLSISSIGAVTGTSQSVTPPATTTFVLTATNSEGVSVTAPTTVIVNAAPPPPPSGTGITIVTPVSGQNVSGVTFITASVTGFTPASGMLDLAVGNFRTGKALSNGVGQYTGGLNLNGLALGATTLTVSATGTNGVFYTTSIPLVLVAP